MLCYVMHAMYVCVCVYDNVRVSECANCHERKERAANNNTNTGPASKKPCTRSSVHLTLQCTPPRDRTTQQRHPAQCGVHRTASPSRHHQARLSAARSRNQWRAHRTTLLLEGPPARTFLCFHCRDRVALVLCHFLLTGTCVRDDVIGHTCT